MKLQVQQSQLPDDKLGFGIIGSILGILDGEDDTTKPPKPPFCPWCRSGLHKDVRESYAERFMKGL